MDMQGAPGGSCPDPHLTEAPHARLGPPILWVFDSQAHRFNVSGTLPTPEMDGLEVCRQLKADEATRATRQRQALAAQLEKVTEREA